MIASIWNIWGAGKKGFSSCLMDFMVDNKLDFIGLQETMKKEYKPSFFRRIDPGKKKFGSGFLRLINLVAFSRS
jgi:hypothetical protein